jgi:hypothetical protein
MHKTLINNGMQHWMHNAVAMAMQKKGNPNFRVAMLKERNNSAT